MPAHVAEGLSPLPPGGVSGVVEDVMGGGQRPTDTTVVISGVSCRLPESDNMAEFRENLVLGKDMVTEDDRRWTPGLYGLPRRNGKLKDISKFDASFFGVHPKQADVMDPQLRMLLEVTYEAIVDAGVSPASVRGSRVGVFIGCSASESHELWGSDVDDVVGYEMTGCTRSMFANRLSYFFDFKGPSYSIDTACSSSLLALDQALRAIRSGLCDSAIVGGTSLCLKPQTSLQFMKLGMLSPDGACKSFDESGNGYCRSEGIVAIFLQKSDDARRVYAKMVHSKSNTDGHKQQGITFPSGAVQTRLLREVYSEAAVDPASVAYVEAHGTGTKAGDPQELNAITEVFCPAGGRSRPLLIGSTKSNMGHPEPASGLAALAKVLIAMEDGYIPANLHYKSPNPDIPALADGRLKVVSERTKWDGGFVGINSFGFGGSNVHVLLQSSRVSPPVSPSSSIPRLVTVSGRTEKAVNEVLGVVQGAESRALESLVEESVRTPTAGHRYRGYVLGKQLYHVQECVTSEPRPLWFVFSGMGTQWHGMGRDLMGLRVFRESIARADTALKPHGIRLSELLMSSDEDTFNDTLKSFVGIAGIQVALTDVLRSIGLTPDGIVGHSVGELGCAYADGGLTADQTVLAAYWRGRCVQEARLPLGAMAAVGLTWEEASRRCPPSVVPACHNSADTVTVSGPAADVREFVVELQRDGVFAKEVKSAGVAFHSYFMASTGPTLLAALKKVITESRPRTRRWLSTSLPASRWDSDLAATSSPEYHVNNLLSPVLFHDALTHVPADAVTVEIAPHGLLQAILKRSLSPECTHVSLMKRGHQDNMEFLLSNLGKLYCTGVAMTPASLYPPPTYPVPRGTPMISPLVKWDHSTVWSVPTADGFLSGSGGPSAASLYKVSIEGDSPDSYLSGHCIDGRVLYPATGYLVLAWRCLAKMAAAASVDDVPVTFRDVQIHRATILPAEGSVEFAVTIAPGSGHFEVTESGALVASGQITMTTRGTTGSVPVQGSGTTTEGEIRLGRADVYKELRLRGYDYGPTFQGIQSADVSGGEGSLRWTGDWVSFLDTMLQIQVLSLPGGGLRLPTRITAVRVDPQTHFQQLVETGKGEDKAVPVTVDRVLDACTSGGVEILGLHATVAPRRQTTQAPPTRETYEFVPNTERVVTSGKDREYLELCLRYASQNLRKNLIKPEELVSQLLCSDDISEADLEPKVLEMLSAQSDDSTLLKGLHDVFTHPAGFSQRFPQAIFQSDVFSTDRLLTSYLEPRVLKPCLDVVLENNLGHQLKVVEFCDKLRPSLFKSVLRYLESQPMLRVEYILTGPGAADVSEADQDTYGVTTVVWDGTSDPPNSIKSANLLILADVLHQRENLAKAVASFDELLGRQTFLLVQETTENFLLPLMLENFSVPSIEDSSSRSVGPYASADKWSGLFRQSAYEMVCQREDGLLSTLYLCRKRTTATADPVVIDVTDLDYSWVDSVRDELANEGDDRPVWLRAEGGPSGVIGMVNCLRQEPGGQRIRCLVSVDAQRRPLPDTSSTEFQVLVALDLVMNVYKDGQYGSYRHLPLNNEVSLVPTENAFVNVLTRGDLSSLAWIQSPLGGELTTDKSLCTVYCTSLNFRDVMLATGKLPPDAIPGGLALQECLLGMEFSGRDSKGQRVMGLLPAKGLATKVDVDPQFLWPVPADWSLEQAATVPVVYATAYYALVVRGRIRRGETVLVHSGSGGVGQAAISVALSYGCQVYVTVGSAEKRAYLKERFPELQDRHFANSRDATFEWDILRATGGRGVDVILNSLAEDKLQASVRILAQHGRFLEIGKVDLANNSSLGMSLFLKNTTFHGILLDALFTADNPEWREVSALLTAGIQTGAVRPLKTTVYERSEVEAAFRFMAQGRHIGKVLIKVRPEEPEVLTVPSPLSVQARPRTSCHPDKTYVITGGLGGFGLELARWLVARGARHLVLTSRSGVRSGYQARTVAELREMGAHVTVSTRDVSRPDDALELIKESGVVGGVFHLAMVLRDGLMANQTQADFVAVGGPKVIGTSNLDQATREICGADLDWFVVFSSVSCGRGNAGQANYGFCNSYMERVCEGRRGDGLHGLAVQWGAIGDVGVVIDTLGDNDTVIGGTVPQRITSCLETLEHFLHLSHAVVSSFVKAEQTNKRSQRGEKTSLVGVVANILGIKNAAEVNASLTLGDLGLDSLMGVEVKQTLERDHDLHLGMTEIRSLTFTKLTELSGGGTTGSGDLDLKPSEPKSRPTRYDVACMMPADLVVPLSSSSDTDGLPPLFVVAPIEGSTVCLQDVVSRVSGRRIYGLQWTQDVPTTSIEDVATYYAKAVRRTQPEGPYHLAGYSFGACVAYEMSLQLSPASLVLLDGSPLYVSAHTRLYKDRLSLSSAEERESASLAAFIRMFVDVADNQQLLSSLMAAVDFPARLQLAADQLPDSAFPDRPGLLLAAKAFCHKLYMADVYRPVSGAPGLPESTSVVLVRAETGHTEAQSLGRDYGLGEVCGGQVVTVHEVPGDHETFILGKNAEKVADIISTATMATG